jgi:putative Holliday junction resolvase
VSGSTRLLGIDYGTVRIGLAVTDPERRIAFPLHTYLRRDDEQDADHFRAVVMEEAIGTLVVGLPVHLSGHEGKKAAEARAFGKLLAEATGLPVVFWDERFTSTEAEGHLLAAGLTNKKRKARRDRVAAQILLQSYVDAGCPAEEAPRLESEPGA